MDLKGLLIRRRNLEPGNLIDTSEDVILTTKDSPWNYRRWFGYLLLGCQMTITTWHAWTTTPNITTATINI